MIVLAGAIILSLNNSGIINKSNEAVDLTNIANVREFAQTKWAEAYLETDKSQPELEKYVLDGLDEADINIEDYDIVVTEKGVTVNKKGEVKIITFIISGVEYKAEEGMTWFEWADSSYNTIKLTCTEEGNPSYYISENQIAQISSYRDQETGKFMLAEGIEAIDNKLIQGKHKITAGADYIVFVEEVWD